jgi:tetratricopeptide (TPR) repeat protein
VIQLQIFQTEQERLTKGVLGSYPEYLIEMVKGTTEERHPVNEALTRPWMKHLFLLHLLRDTQSPEHLLARDRNLLELFKTTIPLASNSFVESTMSSWRMFLDSAFRDAEAPWYGGIKKTLLPERFYSAIEQLELEIPESNFQRHYGFRDHAKLLRHFPRVPVKLLFSLPGNEREKLIEILRTAVSNNPHNADIALLAYCFLKAWGRAADFLELARTENRNDLEEWYFWVEHDMHSLGAIKRDAGDHLTSFHIYDRSSLTIGEFAELAVWYLKENEFRAAYHFYYRAKEFELAMELLQNLSVKEFAELTNLRRISNGEKPFDLSGDLSRFSTLYQEEMETLRGFARIRAQENYKQIAVKARQHFDRETIETKYAFGELSDDEYTRLIRQLQERKQ